MTVAAVVLAAGAGSRFVADQAAGRSGSTHKLLVDFKGRPLMAWALEAALDSGFDQVYLVAGAADPTPALDWLNVNRPDLKSPEVLVNSDWSAGQATSLAVAVDRADTDGHEAVVVGLADQPMVNAECWRQVRSSSAAIATAVFDRRRRPPVRLHRSVWSELDRTGDEGARGFIRLHPELVSEVVCTGNPIDIDTLEDLRQWS